MTPLFIDLHTHTAKKGDSLQIVNLELGQSCPQEGLFSFGIHPWETDKADFQAETALQLLEQRLQTPNVIALGEAGLDRIHMANFERQMQLFERQIVLSENLKKPMILHAVKCNNEIIALRKKHKPRQPWILHGFNGTEQDVKQLIGHGIFLSVGESLLQPNRKICKSLRFIDLDYLFFETDMSEIGVETIYEAAANLLEMDLSTLRMRIFVNFAALWNIGKTEPAS